MVGVGIALGIGMTFLALSAASLELFTAEYRKSGADLYVVTQGGKLVAMLPSDTPGNIKNARHTLAQIRGLGEVNAAIGTLSWTMEKERPGVRRRDEPTELVATIGVDGDPATIPGMLVMDVGRWVRRTDEIILGSKLAKEKAIEVGGTIRLNGQSFTVVGIGKLRGAGFSADSFAYLERQALRQRAEIGDLVNVVAVDTEKPQIVREKLKDLGSFSVSDLAEIVKEVERVNASSVVLRWILVALTLAIAGLFVSNMLLRSVAERRIEFATLSAIGVPRRTILLMIAAQALVISVAAGIIGIAISSGLGLLINGMIAAQYGIEALYAPDDALFALVIFLALGLGLGAGLYPARQATRVDPILVLREA